MPVRASVVNQPANVYPVFVTFVGNVAPVPYVYEVTFPELIVPPFVVRVTVYVEPLTVTLNVTLFGAE